MNKHGQSMIEYVFLAVLVISGIVIMGPYALRSVNAHFKLWDESVQDSSSEVLTQAPVGNVPNISLNCSCPNTPLGCGGGNGSQCAPNQQIIAHNCTPQLCDGAPASFCQNDPTCCTTWSDLGCGTTPVGQVAPANNCNYGYQIQSQLCGSNPATQCVPDATCPMPACQGIPSPGAVPCPTEPPANGSSLTQNMIITYVANPANCSAPCQYYCDNNASYFFNGTNCTNIFTVAPAVNSCGAGACTPSASFPLHSCSQSGSAQWGYLTVNNCSFTIPAPANNATCTAVTVADISSPQTAPYCSNPGHPGEQCQITITY